MKILVTTSVYPRWRGDATPPFVENLCSDLLAEGCQVTVLAPHSPGSMETETRNGIEIIRYRYLWPARLQSLFYEGGMIVRLREKKLRFLQLPFLCFAQYRAISRELRKGFDLLHAHSLLPQGWIGGFSASKRVPLIISSHGSDVFLLKPAWEILLRQAAGKGSALIANSTATRKRLLALGVLPEKIHLIPATTNFSDPDQPCHSPPSTPRLLFAGRLIQEKGIDALVDAMPAVLESFPDCLLLIAGKGNLELTLKARVRALGIENCVSFLNWLEPNALREEMSKATLLIAPSRVTEGQNLVVTEALSVGCPVVVAPRGGMRDLVEHGRTGFIVPDTTATNISRTVINCLSDPDSLNIVSAKGFRHFLDGYSRKQVTQKTLEVYRREIRTE